MPPPVPVHPLVSRTIESSQPSQLSNDSGSAHYAGYSRSHQTEFEDSDDDDLDAYSDDEGTEQAHNVSAAPAPLSMPERIFNRQSSLGENQGRSRGFPLPPPRGESLDTAGSESEPRRKLDDNAPTPRILSFQKRLQHVQLEPEQAYSGRRAIGSLASQPQRSKSPRFPKTSASSSLTEIPASQFELSGVTNGGRREIYEEEGASDDEDGRNFYKRAAERSNLGGWAPTSTPAPGSFNPNLPDLGSLRAGAPTSKPISNVRRDMDWSLKRLISPAVFEQLISDPLGRHRFREYLVRAEGTETKLDMLYDLTQYSNSVAAIRSNAENIHDVYLVSENSSTHVPLPTEIDSQVFGSLKKAFELRTSIDDAQNHLLHSLL